MNAIGFTLLALAIVGGAGLLFWPQVKAWFSDSETIAWAKVQQVAGAVLMALAVADWTPLFHALGWSKYVGVYVLLSGILTEALRKARDPSVQ